MNGRVRLCCPRSCRQNGRTSHWEVRNTLLYRSPEFPTQLHIIIPITRIPYSTTHYYTDHPNSVLDYTHRNVSTVEPAYLDFCYLGVTIMSTLLNQNGWNSLIRIAAVSVFGCSDVRFFDAFRRGIRCNRVLTVEKNSVIQKCCLSLDSWSSICSHCVLSFWWNV
jgi:hypothetical protein